MKSLSKISDSEPSTQGAKVEDFHRALLEAIPDPVFIVDRNYCVEYVNTHGANLLGLNPGEIIGRTLEKLFPPDISSRQMESLKKVFETGQPSRIETEIHYPDGEIWQYSHLIPLRGENGEVRAVLGISREISGQRQERNYFVGITEAMEDGVYIVNQQCDIQYVNHVLKKDFGPYENRKCYEYFHDRKEVCPWCKNQEVWEGKTARWEWHSFKNGRTYDLIVTPLKNIDGSLSKLEIFRDITERKQAEEKLQKMHEHLEDLVRERTDTLESTIRSFHIEIEERKRLEAEREKLIKELQDALAQVKTLQGIIPICMYCKKIRDDKESWHQLEAYISNHTDALFSHGICPECAEREGYNI